MQIHCFEDIKTIDGELACLFLRPDEAVNWIYVVENGIKDWIGKHNKQYWEVVKHVSQQRGIVGKLRKDRTSGKLTREEFACVLLKFCPKAFDNGETVSSLKASMEHYPYISDLRFYENKSVGHEKPHHTFATHHIEEVEALLDQKTLIDLPEEDCKPTLEDIVEVYLRREVEEPKTGFPKSKVCIRPQYDDINPAISVETYKSEQFLKEHRPSSIEAYEFIDGVLQKSKLNEFLGQYHDKKIKLFIVSSSGLLPDVRDSLTKKGVGYVLLNPNSIMTDENYILPRSIEDYTKRLRDLEVLSGTKPMTTPLLIWDNCKLTSSLTDVLKDDGVAVKKHRILNVPYLKEDEIEKCANILTEADVETRIQTTICSKLLLFEDLSLDPFAYAESRGLNHKTEAMEDNSQLGLLDVEKNLVILNAGMDNKKRYRFTMAHELGHYILHSPLFKKQGVVSVGESEDTLLVSENDSLRLEYQANKFASCLLMPKKLVDTLYDIFFDRYVHQEFGDSFHALYYNQNQPETWQSYNHIVGHMSRLLGVSKQAMTIRLLSLELLKMPD